MDQQNQNPSQPPKHVPTEAEIARAEAEAVAALLRGETPGRPRTADQPSEPVPPEAPASPAQADFVPYVDDAPEPEPAEDASAKDGDDDDDEYIPSPWEKRIDALPPEKWRLYQILGGVLVGLAAVASLFVFGEELSTYGIIVAVLLAMLLPRYLERAWRRQMPVARRAMLIAMVAGLAVMFLVTGIRSGFRFTRS